MPASPAPSAPGRARHLARMIFRIGLFGFLAGLVALVIAVLVTMASLPAYSSLTQKPNGQTIRVHAADGTLLVSLGPSYGDWLPYDRIPATMRDAVVAVEDRRFYSHFGIDPIGMARMIWVAKRLHDNGRRLQGASTITQQLARNIFLTSAYNVGRKFREIILALAMVVMFSSVCDAPGPITSPVTSARACHVRAKRSAMRSINRR